MLVKQIIYVCKVFEKWKSHCLTHQKCIILRRPLLNYQLLTYAQNVGSNSILLSLCQDIIPMTFSIHRLFICKICKSHIWQDLERFHLLLFSIKDSIFPIHMIGKFCYKEDKRWVLTYFINRKFHVFNRKFHVLNRKFHFS